MNVPMQTKSHAILSRNTMLRRAVRFALTGVFVTGVHAAATIAFIQTWIPSPPLANGAAFIAATLVSYFINTRWSFSTRLRGRTFARFVAVAILGFLLAMLVALGVQELGFDYPVGIGAVAVTIPAVTFLLHNFWTYR